MKTAQELDLGMLAVDDADYVALVDHELALAASAGDQAARIMHLNRAAYLATLHERSRAPHRPSTDPE